MLTPLPKDAFGVMLATIAVMRSEGVEPTVKKLRRRLKRWTATQVCLVWGDIRAKRLVEPNPSVVRGLTGETEAERAEIARRFEIVRAKRAKQEQRYHDNQLNGRPLVVDRPRRLRNGDPMNRHA